MAGHVPDVPVVRLNVFGISRLSGRQPLHDGRGSDARARVILVSYRAATVRERSGVPVFPEFV